MFFCTVVTNYNEPSTAAQAHIHVATHIEMVKDGDSSTLSNWHFVRMKRNVFKCNKPRGPYHKFGYYPDDGSKQYV